jgi:hypothetical protein
MTSRAFGYTTLEVMVPIVNFFMAFGLVLGCKEITDKIEKVSKTEVTTLQTWKSQLISTRKIGNLEMSVDKLKTYHFFVLLYSYCIFLGAFAAGTGVIIVPLTFS